MVRAGLVPRLRERDRRSVWQIVTMVPSEKPLDKLADALVPLVEPQLSGIDLMRKAHAVAEDLKNAALSLWRLVEGALKEQKGSDRLLRIVDQWEELYTQCEDSNSRRRFVEELLAATVHGAVAVVRRVHPAQRLLRRVAARPATVRSAAGRQSGSRTDDVRGMAAGDYSARQFYPARRTEMEEAEAAFVAASFDAERRRRFRLWSSVSAALIVVCGTIVGVGLWNRNAQNRFVVDRAIEQLRDPLLTNVAAELENLQAAPAYARVRLEEVYRGAPEPRSRLRLAYGLIAVGAVANADHDVAKFILDRVAVAAADDSVNLVEWLFLRTSRSVEHAASRGSGAWSGGRCEPEREGSEVLVRVVAGVQGAAAPCAVVFGPPLPPRPPQ